MSRETRKIAVIGGGAAGFFSAINIAEKNPSDQVFIFEKTAKVLQKVKISGGGRCNVTHACFSPGELIKNYPRGGRKLLPLFQRFQPKDTISWFQNRGVRLKTESDNRIFPASDDSRSIINCLISSAERAGVILMLNHEPVQMRLEAGKWITRFRNQETAAFDALVIATGGFPSMWKMLESMGHKIIVPVPSLFTFNIKDDRLKSLQGVSFAQVVCKCGKKLQAEGPVLITHWGLSGPAILKLSSFGARDFFEMHYRFDLSINFTPGMHFDAAKAVLERHREAHFKQMLKNSPPFGIPSSYWRNLMAYCGFPDELRWHETGNRQFNKIAEQLTNAVFRVEGKSTFKEEFVTCGGVDLKQVDLQRMESRLLPRLFFAGETLNIDAVTGGFNFQSAWTTAWIVSEALKSQT